MRSVIYGLAGLIFGLGLVISGMADPAKVLNFLDVTGRWDPSLAFVMAGAVAVTMVGFRMTFRRRAPVLADRFHLPSATAIESRIIVGPALFGLGWGLAGFCPGPAITSIALGQPATVYFVAAMLVGMVVARQTARLIR